MVPTFTISDTELAAHVRTELDWDPAVILADLGVASSDGQVTLRGTAASYRAKYAASNAAHRVRGVRGLTNRIVVDPAAPGTRPDAAIRVDVRSALALDLDVPLDRLDVGVDGGMVTLSGTLDHFYQRASAEDDARRIAGVAGVTNAIAVLPPVAIADDVAERIAQAFIRHADLFDDNVSVAVAGNRVALGGTVRTWSEYDEAAIAAWRAAGVGAVVNNIIVTH